MYRLCTLLQYGWIHSSTYTLRYEETAKSGLPTTKGCGGGLEWVDENAKCSRPV